MNNLKSYQLLLIFFLLFITVVLYIPMLNAGYALTDDHVMLQSYSGSLKELSFKYIINTFKHCNEGLYHPLVTLAYSAEKTFFSFVPEKFAPTIFHFDNILLHLINLFLVFLILFKLSNSFWLAFITASLFSVHPTRVEVVAWISSRKELLYSLFYLLSIWFYIKTYGSKRIKTYTTLSIIAFLLSCFSKVTAITLPFVLILIDIYTKNFNKNKLKVYFIYFIAILFFIIVNIYAHYFSNYEHSAFGLTIFKHTVNFINAHFNILFYLDKLILPINLYLIYPYFYNKFTMPPAFILYSPAILYILIYLSYLSLQRTKTIFYGFIFFIITILPSSNVLPIGAFAVADRYTYIPYIGLFFIFSKTIIHFYNKYNTYVKAFIIIFCITIFTILNYLTYNRVIDWQTNNYGAPINMEYYEFGIKKQQ